jgi:hypothetical protein
MKLLELSVKDALQPKAMNTAMRNLEAVSDEILSALVAQMICLSKDTTSIAGKQFYLAYLKERLTHAPVLQWRLVDRKSHAYTQWTYIETQLNGLPQTMVVEWYIQKQIQAKWLNTAVLAQFSIRKNAKRIIACEY